jgi:hypothetical protein
MVRWSRKNENEWSEIATLEWRFVAKKTRQHLENEHNENVIDGVLRNSFTKAITKRVDKLGLEGIIVVEIVSKKSTDLALSVAKARPDRDELGERKCRNPMKKS